MTVSSTVLEILYALRQYQRVRSTVVVCFLLGDSPASEFYKATFRNTLSIPSS
jgi:hypothetical protein